MSSSATRSRRDGASSSEPTLHAPPPELLRLLARPARLVLTSHSNPDGDAVGSQIAMYRLLVAAGHRVTVWNLDPVPRHFRDFLADTPWHHGTEPPEELGGLEAVDLVVYMECPSRSRSGLAALERLPAVNIDHHLGNQLYGVVDWVVPASASVSQMALELARALSWPIDAVTAEALLLGLVTDTGSFRYSNSDPAAFRHAAELVALGASPERVAHHVYERRSIASVRLQQAMFSTLRLAAGGRVAVAWLTDEMFDSTAATGDDTEGFVESLRVLDGVEATALLRQIGDGEFKASLRSRGGVDVERVASRHGGGGHRNAAGCRLEGDAEELAARLASELADAVDAASPGVS